MNCITTFDPYEDIAIIMEQSSEMGARIEVARAIARRSPDGNLTPRDIEELITVTSEVQAKVAYLTLLLRLEENALQKKSEEIPKIEHRATLVEVDDGKGIWLRFRFRRTWPMRV